MRVAGEYNRLLLLKLYVYLEEKKCQIDYIWFLNEYLVKWGQFLKYEGWKAVKKLNIIKAGIQPP